MRAILSQLPVLGERRHVGPIKKGPSRLEAKTITGTDDKRRLEIWRAAVYTRDGYRCRRCECKVRRTIEFVANRAEAHHVSGRVGRLRDDVRNGLTLCKSCHELVTGKVNRRVFVQGTRWFMLNGQQYIDATHQVMFSDATREMKR